MKVKIKLTYRGVPYEVEVEAGDKTDIAFLLRETVGDVIASVQNFIDELFAKEEGK